MKSLWGSEFIIEDSKGKSKEVLKKASSPKKVRTEQQILNSKNTSIQTKLDIIYTNVNKILGVYKENTLVIKDKLTLIQYIDKAIENKVIAIDTETNNSLDPLTCKLMGPCIYTPGMKNAYIPINHKNYMTDTRYDWQLTEQDIYEQFSRLNNDVDIITHNGTFDYEVLYCTTGWKMPIYWDTMIGARILNENERAGLKQQYIEKIDSSIEKYSIDHLFDIDYSIVNPEIFALYAATDAYMTYKLYLWQKEKFELPEHKNLYSLFINVEMPVVEVLAEMELTGVTIDKEYAARLSNKYQAKLQAINSKIQLEVEKLLPLVESWRQTPEANVKAKSAKPNKNGEYTLQKSKSEQLKNPPEVSSATQLAILLYDVLKIPVVDKKHPRGTGEEILLKINHPLCKLILEYRGLIKLLNTYIDKLPQCVSPATGRLHAKFNQIGADTGRQSSSDPNLQNIPSHENSIRMMFTASPGYVLVGSDYSQQEPRLLASYSGDENMTQAYVEGKDLYAIIASKVYHNKYEDNKEFYPDGTMNPEGKHRRTSMKQLLLGIMYGRGVASIAEQIKTHEGKATPDDIKEAKKIQQDFFKEFPKVKTWIDRTQESAHKLGYVEDLWGRRRRLPDIQLAKYEITSATNSDSFNPLLGARGKFSNIDINVINDYLQQLENCRGLSDVNKVKQQAQQSGYNIKDNTGYIAQAERQCVNARIQGGAASMTKVALRQLYDNQELRNLGFKLLLSVHDEVIGECPIQNADRVKELLSDIMINAAKPQCMVPMKCDADEFACWYQDVYTAELKNELEKLLNQNISREEALQTLYQLHSEITYDQLITFCS